MGEFPGLPNKLPRLRPRAVLLRGFRINETILSAVRSKAKAIRRFGGGGGVALVEREILP